MPAVQKFLLLFQFHYGTIKRSDLIVIASDTSNFNSTMVRLKALISTLFAEILTDFNSTMVRLKVFNFSSNSLYVIYFNSTMVRLKGSHNLLSSDFNTFQFHYGTIKRQLRSSRISHTFAFQFHYGTIKSSPQQSKPFLQPLFQFHYGTIKRRELER